MILTNDAFDNFNQEKINCFILNAMTENNVLNETKIKAMTTMQRRSLYAKMLKPAQLEKATR